MRLFSLILALILCASLIACGSGKDGEQSFDTETTSEETAEETTKADTDNTETEADTEAVQLEKLPYYAIADSDIFGDALADLANMVRGKYNKEFSPSGSGGIRLTAEGSTDNLISVTLEENELVIRATDAESMKKAVTCFWFENVEYADGDFAPKASFSYSKDLSRTVFYSDFNVKQSESECCIDALIAAHDHANANGYKVFADYGASYYISSIKKTVKVQTDVEWGNARFTIDDSAVANEDRGNWIFNIASSYSSYKIDTLKSISRDAESVELTFPQKSLIVLLDSNTKQYFIFKRHKTRN